MQDTIKRVVAVLATPDSLVKLRSMRTTFVTGFFVFVALGGFGCGSDHDDAEVRECLPEGACFCTEGVERETACVCEGGSSCSIDGDNIEFECDGNAACGLTCGVNCLVTCPGTTTCTVEVGDDAIISCPGTATCNITCLEDCTVEVAGAANATVDCVKEAEGAVCTVNG